MLHQNTLHSREDDILTDNFDFDYPDLRTDLKGSENLVCETRLTTKRDRRLSLRYVVTSPHALPKRLLSTDGDLVLPASIYNNRTFPLRHSVAAYVFFLVFSSLLSFLLSFI